MKKQFTLLCGLFMLAIMLATSMTSCIKNEIADDIGPGFDPTERITFTNDGAIVEYSGYADVYSSLENPDVIVTPDEFNQIYAHLNLRVKSMTPEEVESYLPYSDGRMRQGISNRVGSGNYTRLQTKQGSAIIKNKRWSDVERTLFLLSHMGQQLLPFKPGQSNHPLDFWTASNSLDKVHPQDLYNSGISIIQPLVTVSTTYHPDKINLSDMVFDTAIMTTVNDTILVDDLVVGVPGDIAFVHFSMIDEVDVDGIYGPDVVSSYSELNTSRTEIIHGNLVTNVWQDGTIVN